jgi:predicted NBD/HSP70 family sugar kinase
MESTTRPQSGAPAFLRRLNLEAVLRVLHGGGAHTIARLATAAHLSRPTTKQAVDDLLEAGWIEEVSEDLESRPLGRPAQSFQFRPAAGYVMGVDVGAHKALVLISDLNGTIVARAKHTLKPAWTATERIRELDATIEDAVTGFARPLDRIDYAVIATLGVVAPSGEIVHSPMVPGWQGRNLSTHIAERFGVKSESANDVRMAALAERWRGTAAGVDHLLYVHAGRRLGTAYVLNGTPHSGSHGAAMEIGLWKGLRWADAYNQFLNVSDRSWLVEGNAVQDIFDAADSGDQQARERISIFASELAIGLAPMIVALDPELVVVGGGMSKAGDRIAGPLRTSLNEQLLFPPQVACSTLGDESVALGAVRRALDQTEARLFGELVRARRP